MKEVIEISVSTYLEAPMSEDMEDAILWKAIGTPSDQATLKTFPGNSCPECCSAQVHWDDETDRCLCTFCGHSWNFPDAPPFADMTAEELLQELIETCGFTRIENFLNECGWAEIDLADWLSQASYLLPSDTKMCDCCGEDVATEDVGSLQYCHGCFESLREDPGIPSLYPGAIEGILLEPQPPIKAACHFGDFWLTFYDRFGDIAVHPTIYSDVVGLAWMRVDVGCTLTHIPTGLAIGECLDWVDAIEAAHLLNAEYPSWKEAQYGLSNCPYPEKLRELLLDCEAMYGLHRLANAE